MPGRSMRGSPRPSATADVVIPALRYAGGRRVPTPPTRPGRVRRLDGVRDRLAYRTAPLGLVARERFGAMRFTPGSRPARTSPTRPGSGSRAPRSAGCAPEASTSSTTTPSASRPSPAARSAMSSPRSVPLVDDEWVAALPPAARAALAVKLWRISIFGAVHHRRRRAGSAGDRHALAEVCTGRASGPAPRASMCCRAPTAR